MARSVGPRGRVVAFEPDPANLARTQRNVALNRLTNVSFHQAAIGAPADEVPFLLAHSTNSHLPGVYVGRSREEYAQIESIAATITVRSIGLDEAWIDLATSPPNLIKLDIEGAELMALQHADRLSRELRPIIVLELHNPECDAAAWRWAQKYDYDLQSLASGRSITHRDDVGGTLLCTPR
jgi:FkbM family methyltransferase